MPSKKSKKQKTHPKAKQNKHYDSDLFSSIVAFGIVGFIVLAIVAAGFINSCITDMSYKNVIKKGDHIDEENDSVVLTYPAGIFTDEDSKNSLIDTLEDKDGVKKIVKNSDGSITTLMTVERYEKIKEAVMYSAQSLPYFSITETSAVRDLSYNEDFTQIDITVLKNSETLQSECDNILYMVCSYHICNMKNEQLVTLNYIDSETGEVYLTKTYDTNRNVVS